MQRKRLVMEYRSAGKIKGVKPCVVFLKNNLGKIYNEGRADFILSKKNNILHFQKLSTFLRKLVPADDFDVNLKSIAEYAFVQKTYYNVLCLYDVDKRYIEIYYNKGVADTYPTEDNISRIIKEMEEMGIKEYFIDKGNNDEE